MFRGLLAGMIKKSSMEKNDILAVTWWLWEICKVIPIEGNSIDKVMKQKSESSNSEQQVVYE